MNNGIPKMVCDLDAGTLEKGWELVRVGEPEPALGCPTGKWFVLMRDANRQIYSSYIPYGTFNEALGGSLKERQNILQPVTAIQICRWDYIKKGKKVRLYWTFGAVRPPILCDLQHLGAQHFKFAQLEHRPKNSFISRFLGVRWKG